MSDPRFAFLSRAPVVPVLTIPDAAQAVPLARALVEGGLSVLEVTLRTPAALEAIRRMRGEVDGAFVGAGTVLDAVQAKAAAAAGARFLVSPGSTPRLLDALAAMGLPALPGAATPSEVMALLERGCTVQKFFPAEQSGGTAMLKALQGPLAEVRFCPTGGINAANAKAYLDLPSVIAVGASWPATEAMIRAGAWDAIREAARLAVALGPATSPGRPSP
jgi:2-dehydro-3-deoxyphosphogluconate aldolase/(4S)-4-hydroxy-2-oxoglutarate aldolase